MTTQPAPAVLSVMLAVSDPEAAIAWYQQALGARVLRSLGFVAGLENQIRDDEAPWGLHRQGGFTDPFGHHWLAGDRSPSHPYPV